MSHTHSTVRAMVRCSLFASLLAVCAWISIPVAPIAFTLQSFGLLLALGVLGGKWGSVSILIYLLLGAAGLPVFAGFRDGLSVLLGPSGGYLLGFLAAGLVYWLVLPLVKRPGAAMALGLLVCYGVGTAWFCALTGASAAAALMTCVAPYLLPDALKLTAACTLTRRLKNHLR